MHKVNTEDIVVFSEYVTSQILVILRVLRHIFSEIYMLIYIDCRVLRRYKFGLCLQLLSCNKDVFFTKNLEDCVHYILISFH